MGEYFCDCCGRRLDRSEVGRFWDESLNEIYLYCKYCGGECTDYDLDGGSDNDGYDEYDENDDYDDYDENDENDEYDEKAVYGDEEEE